MLGEASGGRSGGGGGGLESCVAIGIDVGGAGGPNALEGGIGGGGGDVLGGFGGPGMFSDLGVC